MSISFPPDSHPGALAIAPEAPAAEAARLLAARRIGAVPVQDRAGRVIGLISEHDIVRTVANRTLGLRGLAVEDVMSADASIIRQDSDPSEALAMMTRRDLRHAPVCGADGRLLGLVGVGDLMRAT